MKRRNFLKKTGLIAGAAIVAPSVISAAKSKRKLVILHTNDTHSNIEPFPKNHAKYPDMGGVSRRASLIQTIRSQESDVLLLDAGDIFQGTPYFNKFQGVLEMKVMEEMKYDAVTLGNHDFDIGMNGYVAAKAHASFQVLNANYQLAKTPLAKIVQPHAVFKKAGIKVGIFGIGVDLNGLVAPNNWDGLSYQDPIAVVKEQVKVLQKKGCDYIICLSHLGYQYADETKISDLVLAASTSGIDLIIGGHTHTFLSKAEMVTNQSGTTTIVNQVGYGGLHLGRIDVTFEEGKVISASGNAIELKELLQKV
jgi:5'-nucleotidase